MKVLIAARISDKTENYMDTLENMGIDYDVSIKNTDAEEYDGLLLPGGTDINPYLYGEEINGSVGIDDELDAAQWKIIREFVIKEKPIFGICRGCQILNAFFGGTLIQDIDERESHVRKDETTETLHDAVTEENSEMRKLYGERVTVNTSHHQACGKIGRGFKVTMTAPDGIVEGIEHESLPVIAVQWHPERLCFSRKLDGVADGEKIFRYFAGKITEYKK